MTITLRHQSNTFFVQFPQMTEERHVVREAGFRFRSSAARWETSDVDVVATLLKRAPQAEVTAEAAAAVEVLKVESAARAAKAATSVTASAATDASIEIPAPAGLAYLPYQKAGIAYGLDRAGVLIADEMGLGKTIQAIGIVNADALARRVLVVAPAGLKLNWASEFKKWDVKGLSIAVAKSGKALHAADVVIVNYEIVGKLRAQIDVVAWDVLIVDEAHYVKNAKAQRTVAILGGTKTENGKKVRVEPIRARRRVFLTGTPIVNRPSELWPLVRSLDSQGLGAMSWFGFAKRYCGGHDSDWGFVADGATNLDELQAKLRGAIMVRRLKKDVLTELPAKRRQLLPIEPNAEVKRVIKAMEQTEAETKRRLAELRKMARSTDANSETYKEIASEIRSTAQVAFEKMSAHRHELAVAKAPLVVEHVREVLEAEESVVVAVHHLDVVDVLAEGLADLGVHLITGRQTHEQRQAAKEAFQAGEGRVVIGTIGAMAEGWTLTRASTMVFGELDWTPGKISQTEDRIHRIGQENAVLIQHLVVDGSLDATFVEKLVAKQEVIDAAMDAGSTEDKAAQALDLFEVADFTADATTTEAEAAAGFEAAVAVHEEEEAAKEADRERVRMERHAKALALLEGVSTDGIVAAYEAVQAVAAMDEDHAFEENDVGFSKRDTNLGHRLAQMPAGSRDRISDAYAVKLARIYRRQVSPGILARIMGSEKANE